MKYVSIVVIVGFFYSDLRGKSMNTRNEEWFSRDTLQVHTLLQRAEAFGNNQFDSMYVVASRARDLAITCNYKRGEALATLAMGVSQWRQGDLTKGLDWCTKAREIANSHQLQVIETDALINIGLIYNYQGDYPSALEKYQSALQLAESLQRQDIISKILISKGGIYYNLKEYRRALDFWEQALVIDKQRNSESSIASSLNNIGLAHSELGEHRLALRYYFQALSMYNGDGKCSIIYLQENIGATYAKLSKVDSANYYLSVALEGAIACNDPIVQIGVLNSMADVAEKSIKTSQAQGYLERAFVLGKKVGLIREASIAAKSLSELHESTGEARKALHFFKEYKRLADTLYNTENNRSIGRIEAQHEYELRKREQETLQKIETLKKENDLANARYVRNAFIAASLLLTVVTILVYTNYKKKKNVNRRLQDMNTEIERQRKALAFQANELIRLNESLNLSNAALDAKVKERTAELLKKNSELEIKNAQLAEYAFINSHKLRGPVARLLGLIHLFNIKEVSNGERDELVQKIKDEVDALNLIVRQIQDAIEENPG